ncbi:MAG: hypothetical protein ACRC92_14775 [Peptostreptococcaceae bacterium]
MINTGIEELDQELELMNLQNAIHDGVQDAVVEINCTGSALFVTRVSEEYGIDPNAVYSTEDLKDYITLNKDRLMIFIKKLISELIKVVLEFFGIQTTGKKLFMVLKKQLKDRLKSLKETLAKRNESGKVIDWDKFSVEIRDPFKSFFVPLDMLLMSMDYINKAGSDGDAKLVIGKIVADTVNTINSPSSNGVTINGTSAQGILEDVLSVAINALISDCLISETGYNTLQTIYKAASLQPNFDPNDPKFLSVAFHTYSNNDASTKTIVSMINQSNPFLTAQQVKSLSTLTSDVQKNMAERSSEIRDFFDDIETIELETADALTAYIKYYEQMEDQLTKASSVDIGKVLKDQKKKLDNARKLFNKLSDVEVNYFNERIGLFDIITNITSMFLEAKSNLLLLTKKATILADNALTDMLKVEAALS